MRFDLARTSAEAPWVYEGSAFTEGAEHKMRAVLDAAGGVSVDDEAGLPKDVVQRVKMLLRTAHKHALGDEGDEPSPPPRRIRRWRAA